jgi:hypothetical protein
MPLARFEPAIPENELQQTHALDRAAAGNDIKERLDRESYVTC